MKFKPSILLYKVWLVQAIIITIIIMLPVIILLILNVSEAFIFNIIYSSIFIPIFLFILYWMKIFILTLDYEISKDGLIIRGGVWWKHVKTIPYHKITDVKLTQGPVERHWVLGSLSIHTAGHGASSEPEGKLNGLRDFDKIRNEILKHVKKQK